ncbi:hypothetical protein COO72_12275 [Bifidobacterium callitrichos]|nr:hypothetical protein COO72_12275 [Bifidobacterium callitrichos]
MTMYAFAITITQTGAVGIQADSREEAERLFGKAWNDDPDIEGFPSQAIETIRLHEGGQVTWTTRDDDTPFLADLTEEAHEAIDRIKEATR